jgi:transglutaminase-like putative cysteine protease
MFGYSVAHTRTGIQGILDKLSLIESMGDTYAQDRRIQELSLKICNNAGNSAAQIVDALESYVEGLKYRREYAEILRNPVHTALVAKGGDCDDLTTLFLALASAQGLPCRGEVIANEKGQGFHIRAVVGLPPLNPQYERVVDPVWKSEAQWNMKIPTSGGSASASKPHPSVFTAPGIRPPTPKDWWEAHSEPHWVWRATAVAVISYLLGRFVSKKS